MMVQCVTCFGQTQMVRGSKAHPIRRTITYLFHSFRYSRLGLIASRSWIPLWGDVVKQFARANDIDLIARAHQLAMDGYKLMFDKLIATVWSAPNYCYRCALSLVILHATKQNNLPPSHVHSQSGAEMSLRFWNWTRIYVRNTESSLMRLQYVCLTPSSSVVLIIFVGCPFHTSEAASIGLLPLTLFVYSLSMYELLFFGIHDFSILKPRHATSPLSATRGSYETRGRPPNQPATVVQTTQEEAFHRRPPVR